MREVLADRTYARLFAAQIVALLGTGLLTVALGLLAFDLAGPDAGIVLGVALTMKMLAYVGVAPVMAALASRVPRKPLLVSADVVRALVAASLPFVTEVWQILALIFVLQSASATFTPAFQALIPEVLPDERQYTRALSLSRLAYDLESLVSPALAALLLTVLTFHDLFVGTVVGFLASAALVLATRLPALPPAAPSAFLDRLTSGTRIFWRSRMLRALLALDLVVAAPTALVIVNSVVLVQGDLGRAQADVALLLAAYGAGSMVVALALPRVLERVADRVVMLSGGAAAAAGLVLAAVAAWLPDAAAWPALLAVWVVLGAGTACILTTGPRLIRRATGPDERPAAFAAQFSLSHACFIVTYPLAGILGAAIGVVWTALVLALVAVAALALALAAWRTRVPA